MPKKQRAKAPLSLELFRRFVSLGIRHGYYRQYQVVGFEEHLAPNRDTAGIFAPDHQNSFQDTLVLTSGVDRDFIPFSMARSDVFGNVFTPILRWMRMRPVYRRQDGIVDVATANASGFEEIVKVLSKGEKMSIYPEGNHGRDRRLRPLKKGFARIGFQAEEANDFSLGLLIYPVGITYWEHLYPGADVLVKFGAPIPVSGFIDLYREHPDRAYLALKNELFDQLKQLIHHIQAGPWYDIINAVRAWAGPALLRRRGVVHDDLNLRLQAEQRVIQELEGKADESNAEWQGFADAVQAYEAALASVYVTDEEVDRDVNDPVKMWMQGLGLFLIFPVYASGYLANIFPYWASERAAVSIFKDDQFHSSIRYAGTLLLQPLYWLMLFVMATVVTGSSWQSLGMTAAVVVLGRLALSIHRWKRRFLRSWRWFRCSPLKKEDIRSLRQRWWVVVVSCLEDHAVDADGTH